MHKTLGLMVSLLCFSSCTQVTLASEFNQIHFANKTAANFNCKVFKTDRRWFATRSSVKLSPGSLSQPTQASVELADPADETWSCQPLGQPLMSYSIRSRVTMNQPHLLMVTIIPNML